MLSKLSAPTQPPLSRVIEISTMADDVVVAVETRVLLVHREPERELIRTLAFEGHTVLAVADHERPVPLVAVFKPDVVLIVGSNAAGTCLDIRRQAPDVPIVAIVPSRDADEMIAALDAGVDDCLSRPFARAELLARVSAARCRALRSAASSPVVDVPTAEGAA